MRFLDCISYNKVSGRGCEKDESAQKSDDVMQHKPILETTYASPERFHKRVVAYMRYLQGSRAA